MVARYNVKRRRLPRGISIHVSVEDSTTGGKVGSGELGPFENDKRAAFAAGVYVATDITTFVDINSEAE